MSAPSTPPNSATTPTSSTDTKLSNKPPTSIRTMFEFIATVSPVMVVFFIIMISVFNQNAKGLVYLGGLLIAMLLNILVVQNARKEDKSSGASPSGASPSCSVFDFPDFISNHHSSVNSLVLMFTSVYIISPMFLEGGGVNMSVVISMVLFYIVDLMMNIWKKCSSPQGIIIGSFIGAFVGAVWFAVLNASNKNLLFFNELIGDGYYCNKPTEQSFKCKVYKNGQMIGTTG